MKRSIWLSVALISSALLLLAAPGGASSHEDSHADVAPDSDGGVTIEPGMWQVTTTSKIPMVDQTTTETTMQCMAEDHFTPERMTGNHKSCKIDKVSSKDNEMSWKLVCNNPTGQFSGTGRFKSTGDKAEGEMTTTMKLGDQSLVSELRWKGQRLGDCDMELPKKSKKNKQNKKQEKGEASGHSSHSSSDDS